MSRPAPSTPAPVRERILSEWAADPEARVCDIAQRAGCTNSWAWTVMQSAGRPSRRYQRRRETALQRRMRIRECNREFERNRRAKAGLPPGGRRG